MIAFDASSSGYKAGGVGTGTTLTVSHTCTGSNRILFVAVDTEYGASVSSVTYAGSACTYITRRTSSGGNVRMELWYIVAPTVGANNIVITISDETYHIGGGGVSYTGAKQLSQPDASNTGGNSGTQTFDLSVTTTADNCWLVGNFRADVSTNLWTAGTGTYIRTAIYVDKTKIVDSNGLITPAGTGTLEGTDADVLVWYGVMASFAPAVNYTLSAAIGTFVLTGENINLIKSVHYVLSAVTGSLVLIGENVNLTKGHGWALAAATGYLTLTGEVINLFKTVHRILSAIVGSFTLTGFNAVLLKASSSSFLTGYFALTGSSASLVHGYAHTYWRLQVPDCEKGAFDYDEPLMTYDSIFPYDSLSSTGHITLWKLQKSN